MKEVEITCDHSYMYMRGEKFFPIIQERAMDVDSANAILVPVDCSFAETNNFVDVIEQTKEVLAKGKWVVWELQLGCDQGECFLEDSAHFFSMVMLIEGFVEHVWRPFGCNSLGVILYRGGVDFSQFFLWTEQQERWYEEKQSEYPALQDKNLLRRLFEIDVFSDYMHRLASFLPEEAVIYCLFDVFAVRSTAVLAYMLGSGRFRYVTLALKGAKIPLGVLAWEEGAGLGGWIGRRGPYFATIATVSTAVCLPVAEFLSEELLQVLDNVLDRLVQCGVPFRMVEESQMHEEWDEVEDLVVLTAYLSAQGRRKLMGFSIAGGRILYVGEKTGVGEELSLEEFMVSAVVCRK